MIEALNENLSPKKRDQLKAALEGPLGSDIQWSQFGHHITLFSGYTKTPEDIDKAVRDVFHKYNVREETVPMSLKKKMMGVHFKFTITPK